MRTLSWPQPSLVHRQHFWSLTGSLVLLDFACLASQRVNNSGLEIK